MSPRLTQLLEEMTPQEREEVETFAAFVIVRRHLQQSQLLINDISVRELTELVAASGSFDFPTGGFSPPEGRSARGFKPPAFSRFLFQSAVESAETF